MKHASRRRKGLWLRTRTSALQSSHCSSARFSKIGHGRSAARTPGPMAGRKVYYATHILEKSRPLRRILRGFASRLRGFIQPPDRSEA